MSPGFGRCAFILCQSSGIRLICSEVRLRVFSNGELGGTADQQEGGTERPTLSTSKKNHSTAKSNALVFLAISLNIIVFAKAECFLVSASTLSPRAIQRRQ